MNYFKKPLLYGVAFFLIIILKHYVFLDKIIIFVIKFSQKNLIYA